MKSTVSLLLFLRLTLASSASMQDPLGGIPYGPPPIPNSLDGLGPPPAIPLTIDPISASFLIGLAAYGAKKIYRYK